MSEAFSSDEDLYRPVCGVGVRTCATLKKAVRASASTYHPALRIEHLVPARLLDALVAHSYQRSTWQLIEEPLGFLSRRGAG